jgi:hypothetical protein
VEFAVEDHAITGVGDAVEMRLDAVFTSRRTGRRLPMRILEHYTVREGRVHGANAFYQDAQAVDDLVRNG